MPRVAAVMLAALGVVTVARAEPMSTTTPMSVSFWDERISRGRSWAIIRRWAS